MNDGIALNKDIWSEGWLWAVLEIFYAMVVVGILWHINNYGLFEAKSCLYIYIYIYIASYFKTTCRNKNSKFI